MKFYNWLNEKIDGNKIKQFKNDCSFYLNEMKRNKFDMLYSGRKDIKSPMGIKKIEKNREPRDMPIEIHKTLDKYFKKNFGVYARSDSIFVTKSEFQADYYGHPYCIFPVGNNYTFITSNEINDLYSTLAIMVKNWYNINYNDKYMRYNLKNIYNDIEDERKKELNKFLDKHIEYSIKTKYFETKNINKIAKNKEIMLICDKVWLLEADNFTEVEFLNLLEDNINEIL